MLELDVHLCWLVPSQGSRPRRSTVNPSRLSRLSTKHSHPCEIPLHENTQLDEIPPGRRKHQTGAGLLQKSVDMLANANQSNQS